MKRLSLVVFAAALLVAAGGCDTTDNYYESGTHVFTRNVTFSMADAVQNGDVASVQFDVPDVTSNVVNNGTVLVFFREQDTWTAMPYTFGVDNPEIEAVDYLVTLGYAYERGLLEVFYEASTDAVDLLDQPDRLLKLVIIDDFGAGKTGIDLKDYEQVKAYFGLDDES